MSEEEYRALINRRGTAKIPEPDPAPEKKNKGPNKTELAYYNRLKCEFPGAEIRFEALTLYLLNGHKYTPDWVVMQGDMILLVEVKNGAYRHASYGRSKLAFAQAQIDFPRFRYRWAELRGGEWDVKDY